MSLLISSFSPVIKTPFRHSVILVLVYLIISYLHIQTNLLRLGQLQATSLGQLAGPDAPICTVFSSHVFSARSEFRECVQEQPISAVLQRNWLEPCPQHWLSGCENVRETVCIKTGRSTATKSCNHYYYCRHFLHMFVFPAYVCMSIA